MNSKAEYIIRINIDFVVFDREEFNKYNSESYKEAANFNIWVDIHDITDSICSHLLYYNFIIDKKYRGRKGYKYYILFYPVDKAGNKLPMVKIIHERKEALCDFDENEKHDFCLYGYDWKYGEINDIKMSGTVEILRYVDGILQELANGNYDVINKSETVDSGKKAGE